MCEVRKKVSNRPEIIEANRQRAIEMWSNPIFYEKNRKKDTKPLLEKKCKNCGKEFTTKKENKTFCSLSCSSSYNWSKEEFKDIVSKKIKDSLNRPEIKEKMKSTYESIEYKEKISKIQKEVQNRPEIKEANSKRMKEYMNIPENKELLSEKAKEIHNRSEIKESKSKKMKVYTNDNEIRDNEPQWQWWPEDNVKILEQSPYIY
jgi:hypothetical protein